MKIRAMMFYDKYTFKGITCYTVNHGKFNINPTNNHTPFNKSFC